MKFVIATALAAVAGAAHAEVVGSSAAGFAVRNVVEISAPAEKVYRALGEVGRWWSDSHTYSGKAANMSLALEPGGCFCEKLEGGGVRHGVVVLAWPGRTLRLEAALGPLQEAGVAAALTYQIKPRGAGVEVEQTLRVGGATAETIKMAAPVDQVLREQLVRFERYVETGRPD